MLSERARTLLNILVDQYVTTATPVASEEIARLSTTRVSPATVRSTMSQLSDEGYISRPHVSAGGVPSDLGYRSYVESLRALPDLPVALRHQINRHLGQAEPDVEVWCQQCASLLSRITTNLAIVTVPRATSARLKHIQLVYLQEFLVLLIIVLQETRLLRRLLPIEERVDQDLLNQVANKLNDSLSGLTRAELESNEAELTPFEERVKRESTIMMREADNIGALEHYVDGLRLMLSQPEFSQGGRATELVEMLEERVLLQRVIPGIPVANEVTIHIGAENQDQALRPFGVILCGYGVPDQLGGVICVIGPTRMSYAKAISGVRYLSSFMSQLVGELSGGNPTG